MFATSRPGRDCIMLSTWDKAGRVGQAGIVSCFSFNPDRSGVFAAGAYDGSVALYDVNTREQLLLLHGHAGGVTHARFSPDGNYLYTGARRDDRVLCWDVRATSGVVYALHRGSEGTNQRLGFDIEPGGRHLLAGGTVGFDCEAAGLLYTNHPRPSAGWASARIRPRQRVAGRFPSRRL